MLTSNTFNVSAGATYEVSGNIKNITNGEGHDVKVRLENATGSLYADREFDVVATASGTTFKVYLKSNTTAADARLDFILTNPNSDAEFDNIVVRKVTGLNNNARTNEAVLVSNATASATNKACPGLPFCTQYVDVSNNSIVWPTPVNAYSSEIIFWNNDMANILNRPSGTLVPSAGSVPNDMSVTLTWTATNSLVNTLAGNAST